MVSAVVAILRKSLHALVASNSSHQLAAGFALGMVIGLVPKSNLIALSLCILLFSLRVNKGLALAAAALFSFVGEWADPLCHKLGLLVLSAESLQATYASVFSLPLGPWLGFNNTVVMGTSLVGLYLAYPLYYLTYVVCDWLQPFVRDRIQQLESKLALAESAPAAGGTL